jgi:thioredoxin 1
MTHEINMNNFDEFIKSAEITVIDLHALWCNPCKILGPIVETLSTEYETESANVKIGKLNVDENRDKAIELGVSSIPTILVYKNGSLVERHTGMAQKTKLRDLIGKHLSVNS